MGVHKIRKGLDLPIQGQPRQEIEQGQAPSPVGLLADDYIGIKPTMLVRVGDSVRRGQPLFEDKKTPGVRYTAPASGTVSGIHRGERRALQSVVLQLDATELAGSDDSVAFDSYTGRHPAELSSQQVRDLLIESGLWTALRVRPFGRMPSVDGAPHSLFMTVTDSNPLAPAVDVVMRANEAHFARGVAALGRVAGDATIFICKSKGSTVEAAAGGNLRLEAFEGPHPSGAPGLHIHILDPVDRSKEAWHIDYQDVITIGKLFANGKLAVERIVSLAGPAVRRPRLLRTRLGASTA